MPKAIKATDIKYKPTGVLADIIGTRQRKRGQIVKAIWKHIIQKWQEVIIGYHKIFLKVVKMLIVMMSSMSL